MEWNDTLCAFIAVELGTNGVECVFACTMYMPPTLQITRIIRYYLVCSVCAFFFCFSARKALGLFYIGWVIFNSKIKMNRKHFACNGWQQFRQFIFVSVKWFYGNIRFSFLAIHGFRWMESCKGDEIINVMLWKKSGSRRT